MLNAGAQTSCLIKMKDMGNELQVSVKGYLNNINA